ncbi:class I glutamine amidotransferase-like protein [Pholiota conissans]|uniref:Class I glutamine amidotransferase-like protein n=1 Tax=Pholiota conissans TaxID=109636 RepID=A0A9P5YKT0_9AGAR|nr:class I glutamine amidotransferase-like protein [Pholiota conissans]
MISKTVHFGLLLLPEYQWLDAAGPVDLINNHSQFYLKALQMDEKLVAKAWPIEWHYISHNLEPVRATSGPAGIPTHTYDTCPPLDYLIVPGPDPTAPLPEGCVAFLQKLMAQDSFKALLTVCSGSIAVAQAGILDGLSVCSNKWVLKNFAGTGLLNKKVKWVGDRRFIVDGKVWSAGGITAGMDLAAEFARVHFDHDLLQIVKDVSEYEPNPAQPDAFARLLEGVDLN